MSADHFFNSIPNGDALTAQKLIPYFVYYLTVEQKMVGATALRVADCFRECSLEPPASIPQLLTGGLSAKAKLYVKASTGYKLQRSTLNRITTELGKRKVIIQTSNELRSLEAQFTAGDTLTFLREAIDCFEAGANRAAIIMTWVLTVDHLQNYIFKHSLAAFNTAIAAHSNKKLTAITHVDDFADLKEVLFIELCRSANIVTKDERKILDVALGVRNTCAHPSSVVVTTAKAIAVIEDLVTNIITKFVI